MVETVRHAWRFATWHRRERKRLRRLWIVRINAAAREIGTTYSRSSSTPWPRPTSASITQILADLAISDPAGQVDCGASGHQDSGING